MDHAVILVGESGPTEDYARIRAALDELGGWEIQQDAHGELVASAGKWRLKWERHTEFINLALIVPDDGRGGSSVDKAFGRILSHLAPNGKGSHEADARGAGLFARTRIRVDLAPEGDDLPTKPGPDAPPIPDESRELQVIVNGGAIRLSTDLMHTGDGIVVYRAELKRTDSQAGSPHRIGRFVQRVIEVETYRLLAYLAVPMMQEVGPVVSRLEARVNDIAQRSARNPRPEEEAEILTELTSLSAELQSVSSASEFRFAAALAYAAIVDERLDGIREERIEGYQRLSHAVKRRLDPAMRSANALLARQLQVASRIGHITDLLRTRVDLTVQDQNARVLRSIDARANAQLRLQRAVEGLSVVAITYYFLGILGYLIKGSHVWEAMGLSDSLVQALLVIPVVLLVYLGLRKARRDAEAEDERLGE